MPVLWDSKVKFVSVSQFWRLALCSPLGCLCTFHNSTSYCLTWGKEKNQRGKKKISLLLKPVEHVLLVLLDATGRGGLGFTFLPSYGFMRMGTRSGLQYSQLPSLWPRSSMNFQAPISHSASGCPAPFKLRCTVPISHSDSSHTARVKLGLWLQSATHFLGVQLKPSACSQLK